ncbi:MAG: hypothetical protein ACXW07_01590 [Nitrososphaeraceae archaeon]
MRLDNDSSDKNNDPKVLTNYHHSQLDSDLLNQAVEKASSDSKFITSSLSLLKDMKFPTYKYKIINHVKKITNDENIIPLFYTLSDSLVYKDLIHVKNILQSNIPAKNSPSKTKNPDELDVNPLSREKNLATDEKNDSMRQYICNKCGKPFLTREDLNIHQEFEDH